MSKNSLVLVKYKCVYTVIFWDFSEKILIDLNEYQVPLNNI